MDGKGLEGRIKKQAAEIERLRAEIDRLHQVSDEKAAAKAETADELETLFEFQHNRDMQALQAYKDAHPEDPERLWPDRGEMVGWLLESRREMAAEIERLRMERAILIKLGAYTTREACGLCDAQEDKPTKCSGCQVMRLSRYIEKLKAAEAAGGGEWCGG